MEKRTVVMTAFVTVVLWAAVMVDVCWCFGVKVNTEDLSGENAKMKAQDVKKDGESMFHDAKETANSWSDWLHAKYKKTFRSEQVNAGEEAKNLMGSDWDAARKTTDTMNSAASEGSKYASEKTGDVKDFASDKADQVIRMVSDGSNQAGGTFEKAMEYGKDKASNAYDETKQKMNVAAGIAYEARQRMADAIASGRDMVVDAFDMHSDWPEDEEDHAMGHGRSRNDGAHDHTGSDCNMLKGIDIGRSRLGNAYKEAKQNINVGIDTAKEKEADAKETIEKAMEHGQERYAHVRDEAKEKINTASNKARGAMGHGNGDEMEAFEDSKSKVGHAYELAKEKMTKEAKARYEAAKERVSEATGAVGDKMRKDSGEL